MQKCDAKIKDCQDKITKFTQLLKDQQSLRAQKDAELTAHLKLVAANTQTLTAQQAEKTRVVSDLAYCKPIQDKIKALNDEFKLWLEPNSTKGKGNTEGQSSPEVMSQMTTNTDFAAKHGIHLYHTPGGPEPSKAKPDIAKPAGKSGSVTSKAGTKKPTTYVD